VGVDGDEIVFATLPDQRTLKNLRRDPGIALSVPTTTRNQSAQLDYLVVYSTSRVLRAVSPRVLQHHLHCRPRIRQNGPAG
jgi:hypothetical protein